jgi:hypothetical protein
VIRIRRTGGFGDFCRWSFLFGPGDICFPRGNAWSTPAKTSGVMLKPGGIVTQDIEAFEKTPARRRRHTGADRRRAGGTRQVHRRHAGAEHRGVVIDGWLLLALLVLGFTALLVFVVLSLAVAMEVTGTDVAVTQAVAVMAVARASG